MSKWIPVLIIDDDEIIREALKRSLKLYGFKVYPAEDGLCGYVIKIQGKIKWI